MYPLVVFVGCITSISLSCMGLLYCYDKDVFYNISETISWETVSCYHKVNNKIKRVLEDFKVPEEIHIEKPVPDIYKFMGYNQYVEFSCKLQDIGDRRYFIDKSEFDIMFLTLERKGEILWKRILEKSELYNMEDLKTFVKIDKPFLQLEYCEKTTEGTPVIKTEIHTHMKGFYIQNNKILDKPFVNWYINKYFLLPPIDKYELSIIDTNINIFKMETNDFCLLKTDGSYIIKQE